MKLNGNLSLGLATVFLMTTALFAGFNFAFGWVFMVMLVGQGVLVFAVYKVLTDPYHSDKKFEDFYEDRPDLGK